VLVVVGRSVLRMVIRGHVGDTRRQSMATRSAWHLTTQQCLIRYRTVSREAVACALLSDDARIGQIRWGPFPDLPRWAHRGACRDAARVVAGPELPVELRARVVRVALPPGWRATAQPEKESGQAWVHQVERDQSDGQLYALKRLKNPERRDRFRREVETMLRLRERGLTVLPEVVDHDLDTARPWFVNALVRRWVA
jgi:hypothetical protein